MSLRRLILPLAILLSAAFAAPAHAGWLQVRKDKKQQQARQAKQKQDTDDLNNRINSKSKQEAERWAKQQRIKPANVKTYSSQVPSSNYRQVGTTQRQVITLAMKLGGSKRYGTTNVSTTRALLLRKQSGVAPIFGWKTVTAHNSAPYTGAPTLFAFNRF